MRTKRATKSTPSWHEMDSEGEEYYEQDRNATGALPQSQPDNADQPAGHPRRRTQRRRYSDMISSDEEFDMYDDEVERQANRECARRIRQKKQDLMNQLTEQFERLQRRNEQLLGDLQAISAQWKEIEKENCELQADLALAKAIKKSQAENGGSVLQQFHQIIAS